MFDVNCAIGHWPFRKLMRNTVGELKDYLRSCGVTGGALTHNHAVCYVNAQDANAELFEAIRQDGSGFFVGVATLNPAYAAWRRDLATCVERFGFRAVRVLPKYHNYLLNSRYSWELFDAAAEYGIPVVIPREIVNYRQRSWLEPEESLPIQEIIATARRFPNTRFLVMESEVAPSADLPANLYVEMSRFHCCQGRKLDKFITGAGADHVLYGSGAPFREIENSLLLMHHVKVSDSDRALIEHGNAERLFGLKKQDGPASGSH